MLWAWLAQGSSSCSEVYLLFPVIQGCGSGAWFEAVSLLPSRILLNTLPLCYPRMKRISTSTLFTTGTQMCSNMGDVHTILPQPFHTWAALLQLTAFSTLKVSPAALGNFCKAESIFSRSLHQTLIFSFHMWWLLYKELDTLSVLLSLNIRHGTKSQEGRRQTA